MAFPKVTSIKHALNSLFLGQLTHTADVTTSVTTKRSSGESRTETWDQQVIRIPVAWSEVSHDFSTLIGMVCTLK